MNKATIEMLKDKCEKCLTNLLRNDFDIKSIFMFILSFINKLLEDEIEHNTECGFLI